MTALDVNAARDTLQVNVGGDYLRVGVTRVPPDYPETPVPRDATITSYSPTWVTVSNSLRRKSVTRGAHAWQITMRYGAMSRATFAPLWAFLVSQAGRAGSFTAKVPAMLPQGTTTGVPRVNGANQTGSLVVTDGWTAGATVYKAGDWVQFDGDEKVYMVTADVVADGSGNASIPIYPALMKSPIDNIDVVVTPYFTVSLMDDITAVDISQCVQVIGFEVQLVEVAA